MLISKKLENVKMSAGKAAELEKEIVDAEKKYGKENIIRSVAGCYFDEDENFFALKTVKETYLKLSTSELFNYTTGITGTKEFKETIKKNIFADNLKNFENSHIGVAATVGGSGAIYNVFRSYMDEGQTVLLPDFMWSAYTLLAEANGLKYDTYSMFKNNKFTLENLSTKVLELARKQSKILLLINDPCHNPTGYSLSYEEWEKVIEILKEAAKCCDVILLNDTAYIDYDFRGRSETRRYLKLFSNLAENILPIIAFSISKSLTSYGLRVGSEIAISSSKAVIDEFNRVSNIICRSTWSNISRGGMELFTAINSDDELFKNVESERDNIIEIIKERAKIFIEESKKVNLNMLPYKSGFFITIPISKEISIKVAERLKEKNIFILPIDGGLRIAICSVTREKIRLLPKAIKEEVFSITE